jgi:hypothetical protein
MPGRRFKGVSVDVDTNNQSIAAGGTYTHQIALGSSDFTHGQGILYNEPTGTTDVSLRRLPVVLFFGNNEDHACAAGGVEVSGDLYPKGYSYARDSQLTEAFYSADNDPGTSIRITSAEIVGSNLEIVFTNTDGSNAHNVDMVGRIQAFS